MSKTTPRGIRNKNPGNLEWGDPWQGLDAAGKGQDSRFAVFTAPAWGIRALARTLITYQDKYGIRTIDAAIRRWAPPVENDTGSYVRAVANAVGVSPVAPVNFHDHDILRPLVEAIIRHENGAGPLRTLNTWYDATTIDEGLRLAGVVQPKPALATVEGAAAGTAVAAGGAAAITEVVAQLAPAVTQVQGVSTATAGLPGWLRAVIVLLTVAAVVAAGVVLVQKSKRAKAVQQ
ncbi:hypothetical protein [Orrella dioscoreae]|uniref:Structural protein P5 n=1 Tax=Orrella dioscoreae TaxID=1851544 RepID=A0A1C3K1E7_9BURK|nr:hypothetical protein [Orrella dioscoreae]SBT25339.1 Structural protein P5 [Orrella dioscoreae]SOE49140.1 Structural protein P5 [Orrella dioscoreae]